MKILTAFRLQQEVLQILERESKRTGLDKTSIVEWCVRRCAAQIPEDMRLAREAIQRALSAPMSEAADAAALEALRRAVPRKRRGRSARRPGQRPESA